MVKILVSKEKTIICPFCDAKIPATISKYMQYDTHEVMSYIHVYCYNCSFYCRRSFKENYNSVLKGAAVSRIKYLMNKKNRLIAKYKDDIYYVDNLLNKCNAELSKKIIVELI